MSERPDRCLLCEARYSNPVCRMNSGSLTHFASLTSLASYDSGQKLFSQGDMTRNVFLIRSGQVKLVHSHADGAEQILRTAGAGETLGIGAAPDVGMIVSAIATLPTQVCRIPMSDVEKLLPVDSEFSLAWSHLLTDEIRRSREAILNLGPQTAGSRLALYLFNHCRDQLNKSRRTRARTGAPADCLVVRTTHADLAATLSIAQETMTRLLGSLQEAGVLKLKRGRIEILDLDRLAALAGFPDSKLESA